MYRKQLYLALIGVGVCVLPATLPLGTKLQSYLEAQQYKVNAQLKAETLRESESLKRLRIAERTETSNALYQAGVMPTTQKLRITNYRDGSRNPRPDTSLYQEDEIITVYDAAGRCIGEISDGVWKWKRHTSYRDICQGVQPMKPVTRRR